MQTHGLRHTLILAVILRLVFASFLYHPDLKSQQFHGSFLTRGIWNIYAHLDSVRPQLPYTDTFNYPPLAYFFFGTTHAIARAVNGPGVTSWVWDWDSQSFRYPDLFAYLLTLKLPYLVLDLLILVLLYLHLPPPVRSRFSLIYLFNPISLYAVYAIGQFDIVPASLTVAALILASRNRLFSAAAILGLAAAFKTYPLLLVPFLILRAPSWPKAAAAGMIAAAFYLLPLLPFWSTPGFQSSVLGSNLGARLFTSGFPLGPIHVPYFGLLYVALLLISFLQRNRKNLLPEFAAVTLSGLVFTQFHAQWIAWCLPFLCALIAQAPKKFIFPAISLTLSFFAYIFLLPDQFVLTGLFVGLNPSLSTIPSFSSLISAPFLPSLAHALFTASGLIIIYLAMIRSEPYEN